MVPQAYCALLVWMELERPPLPKRYITIWLERRSSKLWAFYNLIELHLQAWKLDQAYTIDWTNNYYGTFSIHHIVINKAIIIGFIGYQAKGQYYFSWMMSKTNFNLKSSYPTQAFLHLEVPSLSPHLINIFLILL